MSFIFNDLIYRPIYNLLIFVYNNFPIADFGLAIIIVTVLTKMLLIPLSRKQIESQKKLNELQPKIKELQQKYKNDKEKQSRAIMELYKENKTNPFSGCLPMIVQIVFLIAIYRVFFNISDSGLKVDAGTLYAFVHNPEHINSYFIGLIDLSSKINLNQLALKDLPQLILVVLAALSQYIQTKMLMAKKKNVTAPAKNDNADFSQIMSKQMLYFGPLLTLFIGIKFPAGLSLYWLVSTLFMIAQQYYLEKKTEVKEGRQNK